MSAIARIRGCRAVEEIAQVTEGWALTSRQPLEKGVAQYKAQNWGRGDVSILRGMETLGALRWEGRTWQGRAGSGVGAAWRLRGRACARVRLLLETEVGRRWPPRAGARAPRLPASQACRWCDCAVLGCSALNAVGSRLKGRARRQALRPQLGLGRRHLHIDPVHGPGQGGGLGAHALESGTGAPQVDHQLMRSAIFEPRCPTSFFSTQPTTMIVLL